MIVFRNVLLRILRTPSCFVMMVLIPLGFMAIGLATEPDSDADASVSLGLSVGVLDEDGSLLSKQFTDELGKSYTIVGTTKKDYKTQLTDNKIIYALMIPKGFGAAMASGDSPVVQGYALQASEYPYLVEAAAGNILRGLKVLAFQNDTLPDDLGSWLKTERVKLSVQKEKGDVSQNFSIWIGMYAMALIYTACNTARPILQDRMTGMWGRLGAAPISSFSLLLQTILGVYIPCGLQSTLFMFAMRYGVGYQLDEFVKYWFSLMIFTLFCVGLGVMIYSVASSNMAAMGICSPVATFLAMLGGLFWPIDVMPAFMKQLARLTPTFWFGNSIAKADTNEYWLSVLIVLGFAGVCLLIGSMNRLFPKKS